MAPAVRPFQSDRTQASDERRWSTKRASGYRPIAGCDQTTPRAGALPRRNIRGDLARFESGTAALSYGSEGRSPGRHESRRSTWARPRSVQDAPPRPRNGAVATAANCPVAQNHSSVSLRTQIAIAYELPAECGGLTPFPEPIEEGIHVIPSLFAAIEAFPATSDGAGQ